MVDNYLRTPNKKYVLLVTLAPTMASNLWWDGGSHRVTGEDIVIMGGLEQQAGRQDVIRLQLVM